MLNQNTSRTTICVRCEQEIFVKVGNVIQCIKCRNYSDIQEVYVTEVPIEGTYGRSFGRVYTRITSHQPGFAKYIEEFCVGRRKFNEF